MLQKQNQIIILKKEKINKTNLKININFAYNYYLNKRLFKCQQINRDLIKSKLYYVVLSTLKNYNKTNNA